ncbi:hypothetical protein ACS0TY_022940 [Phlomoides rotata]
MLGVLNRKPWHFDKNVVLLKELGSGEQPSTIEFTTVTFWVRLYDLPMSARNPSSIKKIGECIGEVVEIDPTSLDGVARSIRIKVKIDYSKPLRRGIFLELKDAKQVWVNFKYERLPSFCYLCGVLGHMRRECDLAEGGDDLNGIPDDSLPFGKWMRASPMKKASVSSEEQRRPMVNPLRRQLFEKFKQEMSPNKGQGEEGCAGNMRGERRIRLVLRRSASTWKMSLL